MRGRAEFPDGFGVDPTLPHGGRPARVCIAHAASPAGADPGVTMGQPASQAEAAPLAVVQSAPPVLQPAHVTLRRSPASETAGSLKQASGATIVWVSALVGLLLAASVYYLDYL